MRQPPSFPWKVAIVQHKGKPRLRLRRLIFPPIDLLRPPIKLLRAQTAELGSVHPLWSLVLVFEALARIFQT